MFNIENYKKSRGNVVPSETGKARKFQHDYTLLQKIIRKSLSGAAIALLVAQIFCAHTALAQEDTRPNILFMISDDISWFHAGAYGDNVVKTPAFDQLAAKGVLFTHAFCSAPTCSPSRAAILTGQDFWRLGEAANLRGTLHKEQFKVYPFILEKTGYIVGSTPKAWNPGSEKAGGWAHNPAGPTVGFEDFLKTLPEDKPFCYWQGSWDAHRPYEKGSGLKSGMKAEDVKVPPFLPDVPEVREDILDYYYQVQRFDQLVETDLKLLEESGRAENTIVVVTSDNGMPFPRAKAELYDYGTRMPLAISWPKGIRGGRVVHDFVSLIDLAPTFLEAAGLKPPPDMTGRSLLALLTSDKQGWVEPERDACYFGRELHAPEARKNMRGYPSRAIRTKDFLYIRNFAPNRWPVGNDLEGKVPFRDVDASPTKTYMIGNKEKISGLYELAFGQRPAEELYDLDKDPAQMINVAAQAEYNKTKQELSARLEAYLKHTCDPRMGSDGNIFESYPIWKRIPKIKPAEYKRINRGTKLE